MTAFRDRTIETQRQCDRLIGSRNARLRFDLQLADVMDVGGNSAPESWRVWVETPDGRVLASGTGYNGSVAFDAMLKKLKELRT